MQKKLPNHKEHSVSIKNREEMTLTGVCEVVSFTDSTVVLKTGLGELLIKGDCLNIGRLNTETGELFVCGTITLLRYSKLKKDGGMFEGLFK